MTVKLLKAPEDLARMAPPAKANRCHRILVVDNEPDIRQLNTEVLTECGYKVDVAEDGLGAWQALNSSRYDLLITDNEMPKASGVELLEKLHEARIPLPVIMMSGTIPSEQLYQRPWLQIHAMLLKPYTNVELLAKVRQVLHTSTGCPGSNGSSPNRQGWPAGDGMKL